jgi:hypothetical protein
LDAAADKARAEGKTKLADRLDRRGNRIENHLDKKGDLIEGRVWTAAVIGPSVISIEKEIG